MVLKLTRDGLTNKNKNKNGQPDKVQRNWGCRSMVAAIILLILLFLIGERQDWELLHTDLHALAETNTKDTLKNGEVDELVHNKDNNNDHIADTESSPRDTAAGAAAAAAFFGVDLTNSSSPVHATASTSGQSEEKDIKSTSKKNSSSTSSPYEIPFAVFGSLQYRRVCSPIGLSSVVCMTIRFPWADGVPLQDETVSYPKPVDERFYDLDKEQPLVIVDGDLLEECKALTKDANDGPDDNADTLSPLDDVVKRCLDMVASKQPRLSVVVVCYREQRNQQQMKTNARASHVENEDDPSELLFGTGRGKQLSNALEFFDGHAILVFGDSTSPTVTICMEGLFGGRCGSNRVSVTGASFYCGGRKKTNGTRRKTADDVDVGGTSAVIENDTRNNNETGSLRSQRKENITELAKDIDGGFLPTNHRSLIWRGNLDDTYNIFLGTDRYDPPPGKTFGSHALSQENLVDHIVDMGMKRDEGWTELRDLTIYLHYPFAHTQSQPMIYNGMG